MSGPSDEAPRDALEAIDTRLVELLSERARLVHERAGRERNAAASVLHHPERDARRLREIVRANGGPLGDAAVRRVFEEVLHACAAHARAPRIAYLGPEGTYSEAAVHRHFGHDVESLPERAIPDIFQAVEAGRADFGVVPVENSTEGAVTHTLDLLMETPLRIGGEVRLRIRHNLLARVGALDEIRRVHAHPQALAQCRRWLDAHLPGAERVSETSNAAAAARVAGDAGLEGAAAVAGEAAAERYALAVLEAGIEDVKTNTTRFLVMGDRDVPPSGDDTTSLLLSAPHRPGGLRRMLEPFETAGLSLTRIESRPARSGLWQYVFFVDIVGHRDEAKVRGVLARLVDELPLVRVLGSYPTALS